MNFIWCQLRTGAWLTPARLRGYTAIFLAAYVIGAVTWIALSHGMIDRNNKPLGTDFSNVYAAGTLTLGNKPDAAYDWAAEYAVEKSLFGVHDLPFYGWHYPPLFLLVAAGLALMPYGWALAVWMATTLPAYVVAMRAIVPRPMTVLVSLAFPAVFVNLGHGQNGFMSAALLGGALLLLDTRPIAAGILIGMLAYKPQFGILIPLVLLVTGRWTVILAACGTVLAVCAATLTLLGSKVWVAFAASTTLTRRIVLEAGDTGWEKIQSAFSAVRMWGGSVDMASSVQAGLAIAVAAGLVWLWRSEAAADLKAAGLAVAVLIATPYVLDYDLMMLAVAIAFYARHAFARGFRDFEISLLAFAWATPLLARPAADMTGIPLGLIAQLALFIMTLERARRDIAVPRGNPSLAQA